MEIEINKNKKISSIQNEFQKQFPFLKIEFYKRAHSPGEGSSKENTLDSELSISDVQAITSTGTMKIHAKQKVADLETEFEKTFGLAVQVFRKSGNVWLQTTTTDNWTLEEQNNKGLEMGKDVSSDEIIINADDRRELE